MTSLGRTFKKAKAAADARAALEAELPQGTDVDAARAWLNARGIPFTDEGSALRFTLDGPRRGLMVSVRWIVAILIADGKVSSIEVDEGLLGP